MFKFVFVRTPKPRSFNHKPIYWNPDEEEHKERVARLQKDVDLASYKPNIKRGSFRRSRWDSPDETSDMQRERRRSNIRLLLIIFVLLVVAAVFYLSSGAYLDL